MDRISLCQVVFSTIFSQLVLQINSSHQTPLQEMSDVLSPFTISPPPPLSSNKSSSSMAMLYYGLVVVVTAAIVIILYNLIIIKRCSRRHHHAPSRRPNGLVIEEGVTGSRSYENSQRNLLSSFKYKKETREDKQGGDDYECPVCLSVYEEGEEVKKLPRCKHSFHAPCIDMWLYSHFDCPVCRTPVGPFYNSFPVENSREGLLEAGGNRISVQV